MSSVLHFIHFNPDTCIIQSISTVKPYKNQDWPLYKFLAKLLLSKASGQIAFHPLLELSVLSMSSTSSSSAAPQPYVLNTLEKGTVGLTNIMLPPSIPFPFDAAQQPAFSLSIPGTSTSMLSILKLTLKALGKCKAEGDDNTRLLNHPSRSMKEATVSKRLTKFSCITITQAFWQIGSKIEDLNMTFSITEAHIIHH